MAPPKRRAGESKQTYQRRLEALRYRPTEIHEAVVYSETYYDNLDSPSLDFGSSSSYDSGNCSSDFSSSSDSGSCGGDSGGW